MAIAPSVQQYLAKHGVDYDTVSHRPTQSSSETAQASHVDGDRIAKGIVLDTGEGYLLAVLPASRHVQLSELKAYLNRHVTLASEDEVAKLFADCEVGAVPAVGAAYGLDVIVDESLAGQPEVYFEAGDHATLVRVTGEGFRALLGEASSAQFGSRD